MNSRALFAMLVLGSFGCDRKGTDLLPSNSNFEPVITIGALDVLSPLEYAAYGNSANPHDWCQGPVDQDDDGVDDTNGVQRCFYGQVGMPEAGIRGGASYTFEVPTGLQAVGVDRSTGETEYEAVTDVCIIVDPETVFWNHSVAQLERETKPLIADYFDDDGDMDLFVGMSSYYTGSPGVELGDFRGYYTDSLGRTIEIEYGECIQRGQTFGEHHSGRAALEYCDIDVEGREGVQFTVVLGTFSVPLNDGALSFGTMVYGGRCSDIVSTPAEELVIRQESLEPTDGFVPTACTPELEIATIGGIEQDFCCVHPGMCSDRAPEDACDTFIETYSPEEKRLDSAAEKFCSTTGYSRLNEASGEAEALTICCEEQAVVPVPSFPSDCTDELCNVISTTF